MDPMKKFFSFVTILVATGLLITSCQPGTASPSPAASEIPATVTPPAAQVLPSATLPPTAAAPQSSPVVSPSLERQTWRLVSYIDAADAQKTPIENTQITATFENGKVTGNASCNRYFASYQLNGDKLTISNAGSTMMACLAPGVMVQEAAYLEALQKAAKYQIKASQLEIADVAGKTILVFAVQQPVGISDNLWQLAMYASGVEAMVSTLAGTKITAMFSADGSLSGSAGCNQYNTTYSQTGSSLVIQPIVTTRKACASPAGIMEQEAAYLDLLHGATAYQIKDKELRLSNAEGRTVLIYNASSQSAPVSAQTPLPVQTLPAPAALALESLKNADYRSGFTVSGRAPLSNGEYREAGPQGSASETVVRLVEPVAYGELPDGQLASVLALSTETGGSGTFYELALVTDLNGAPLNIASVFLGDRIQLNSLKLENGQVLVDMVKQGPNDPMCCPTLHVLQKYALQGTELALVSTEEIK
jgi:heat shock protein HslJ